MLWFFSLLNSTFILWSNYHSKLVQRPILSSTNVCKKCPKCWRVRINVRGLQKYLQDLLSKWAKISNFGKRLVHIVVSPSQEIIELKKCLVAIMYLHILTNYPGKVYLLLEKFRRQ